MSELTAQPFERLEDYQSMDTFKDIGLRKLKTLSDKYPHLINFIPSLLQTTIRSMEEIMMTILKSHLDSLLFEALQRYEQSPHRRELLIEAESALKEIQKVQTAWGMREEIGFEDITQVGRFEERFIATEEDVHALANAYQVQGIIEQDAVYKDLKKLVRLLYRMDPKIQFSKAGIEFSSARRDRSIRVIKEASLVRPLMVTDDKMIQTLRVSDEWVEPDPPKSQLQPHTAIGYGPIQRRPPARNVEIQAGFPSPLPPLREPSPAVPQLRQKSLQIFTRGYESSQRRPLTPRRLSAMKPLSPLSNPGVGLQLPPPSQGRPVSRNSTRGVEDRKWSPMGQTGSQFSHTSRLSRSRGKSPLRVRNTGYTRYLVQPKESTNEIVVTDVTTKEFKVIETSATFSELFAVAQLTNAVFVAGGKNASSLTYLVRHDGETQLRAPLAQG